MVKIRRSRQPRDWQNQTHTRSVSSMLGGKQFFNPINADAKTTDALELTPEVQIKKLQKVLKDTAKRIKRLIGRIPNTPKEQRADLEAKIAKREHFYTYTLFRITTLERKIIERNQRVKTRKENEEKASTYRKLNTDKVVARNNKLGLSSKEKFLNTFNPQKVSNKDLDKQRIEVAGGKRRVKLVRKKRWAES